MRQKNKLKMYFNFFKTEKYNNKQLISCMENNSRKKPSYFEIESKIYNKGLQALLYINHNIISTLKKMKYAKVILCILAY